MKMKIVDGQEWPLVDGQLDAIVTLRHLQDHYLSNPGLRELWDDEELEIEKIREALELGSIVLAYNEDPLDWLVSQRGQDVVSQQFRCAIAAESVNPSSEFKCELPNESALPAIEDNLSGQKRKLLQCLRQTRNFVSFDSLAESECFRTKDPIGPTVEKALKRLKEKISEYGYDIEIRSSERRVKLFLLREG